MYNPLSMVHWIQLFSQQLNSPQTIVATVVRLLLACVLGGMIGIERELKHKPAGLRTQMLICVGSAFFTILSDLFAQLWGGDHTRIAAQIIPGIGFIGAGSILRSRGSVSGLTTAATIFVVAAIGMAAGGGMYLPATFAAALVLGALYVLGILEGRLNLKAIPMEYMVHGDDVEKTMGAVDRAIEQENLAMQTVRITRDAAGFAVQFSIDATRREHDVLVRILRQAPEVHSVGQSEAWERE